MRSRLNVLVLGSGGREHAIVDSLARSPRLGRLYCYPGNPGIRETAGLLDPADGSVETIVRAAAAAGVDLVVVGPETLLAAGIADECEAAGIPVFGPGRSAARLESSKAWARQVMLEAGVPSPRAVTLQSISQLEAALDRMGGFVAVKADGLAAGKGVLVTSDPREATEFATRYLQGDGAIVVVEEALAGEELSVFAFVSGRTVVPLAAARDYKRAHDGDRGPNTGGMGAISPVSGWDERLPALVEQCITPAAEWMAQNGIPFRGVVFAGLMLTASGPSVLEYNARFGDPETQTLLPRLQDDLAELMYATATATLEPRAVRMSSEHTCCVTVASAGYPSVQAPPARIEPVSVPEGTRLYHAGTAEGPDGIYAIGGRIFSAVGLAPTAPEARRRAYSLAEQIRFEGAWYRTDIGDQRAG